MPACRLPQSLKHMNEHKKHIVVYRPEVLLMGGLA